MAQNMILSDDGKALCDDWHNRLITNNLNFRMSSALLLRITATFAFIGMIAVNALANVLPINGLSTGAVANRYPSLFTPAGFTFGIWSLIYLLMTGFIIYAWLNRNDRETTILLPWFILSCILNVSWILAWHYLMPLLSVVIMLGLLGTLSRVFLITHQTEPLYDKQWLVAKLPFAVYFSWICVATIANISAYLTSTGWNRFSVRPEIWTVIMLGFAGLLALKIFFQFRSPVVVAVLLWTLAGIYFRWRDSDYVYLISATPIIALMLISVTGYYLLQKRRA
jgi:benzodiazapine receptor